MSCIAPRQRGSHCSSIRIREAWDCRCSCSLLHQCVSDQVNVLLRDHWFGQNGLAHTGASEECASAQLIAGAWVADGADIVAMLAFDADRAIRGYVGSTGGTMAHSGDQFSLRLRVGRRLGVGSLSRRPVSIRPSFFRITVGALALAKSMIRWARSMMVLIKQI